MVSWQNTDYYRGLKQQERETGWTVADHNRVNNPYGSHSFGGLLLSQMLPQLLMGGAEKLGEYVNNTGSKTSEPEDTVESLTNAQNTILVQYKANDVSDIESQKTAAEQKYEEFSNSLSTCKENIKALNEGIDKLNIDISTYTDLLKDTNLDEETQNTYKEVLDKAKKDLEEARENLSIQKEDECILEDSLSIYSKKITTIKTDIIDLKDINRRLEVAKAKELKTKVNEETESISNILKEYKNADESKKDELLKDLNNAISTYRKNYPETKNKTIDRIEDQLQRMQNKGSKPAEKK